MMPGMISNARILGWSLASCLAFAACGESDTTTPGLGPEGGGGGGAGGNTAGGAAGSGGSGYNVAGVGGDAGSGGAGSGGDAGSSGDAGSGGDGPVGTGDYVAIEWDIFTSGGFSGRGMGSLHLKDGLYSRNDVDGDLLCSETLQADQLERLLNAANEVDWGSLDVEYPVGGADLFQYDMEMYLTPRGGGSERYDTRYWDTAPMPQALVDFLITVSEISTELGIIDCGP